MGMGRHVTGRVERVVLRHGPKPVRLPKELVVEVVPQVDPAALLLDRWREVTRATVLEHLTPVVAAYEQRIADLSELLRLERIDADQGDRDDARVQRALEGRVTELQTEIDARERHIVYLRSQLANRQPVVGGLDREAMTAAITEASRGLRAEIAPLPSEPTSSPSPAPFDLSGLESLVTRVIEALAAQQGDVELVRDDRTREVIGARRKRPVPESGWHPEWPPPLPGEHSPTPAGGQG